MDWGLAAVVGCRGVGCAGVGYVGCVWAGVGYVGCVCCRQHCGLAVAVSEALRHTG